MDTWPLSSVMQKSIIHKASASAGWRWWQLDTWHKTQRATKYIEEFCTTSHSSDLLMKMGCKIRKLEGIDTFLSMEMVIQYYRT